MSLVPKVTYPIMARVPWLYALWTDRDGTRIHGNQQSSRGRSIQSSSAYSTDRQIALHGRTPALASNLSSSLIVVRAMHFDGRLNGQAAGLCGASLRHELHVPAWRVASRGARRARARARVCGARDHG